MFKTGIGAIDDFNKTIGSFIPGIGDAQAQEEANEANKDLYKMNRDFQEKMANTAYQRAMADMKKAGLNPMLAYQQGGAAVPNTAAPTVSPVSRTGLADKALQAYTGISAAQTSAQQAQTQQAAMESTKTLQDVQTAKTVAETRSIQLDNKRKEKYEPLDDIGKDATNTIKKIFDKVKEYSSFSAKNIKVENTNPTPEEYKKIKAQDDAVREMRRKSRFNMAH